MAPPTPTTHDPALSHSAAPGSQPAQIPAGVPTNIPGQDLPNLGHLDQSQIMNLLRNFPVAMLAKARRHPRELEEHEREDGVSRGELSEHGQGNPKEDAAQTLSNLSQNFGQQLPVHFQTPGGLPGISDPGPSSHPRGPPNLGQLSAVAMQATPVNVQPPPPQQPGRAEEGSPGSQVQNATNPNAGENAGQSPTTQSQPANASTGGRRAANRAQMGSDEWTRMRKDNHKEVERRRRGNINEGINELGRIVPSGSGEKAKGAILARAVQYIHHLKENEARNIEKWTLEKLLMDQAMGDLQAQLEEVKRMWDEERMARTRLEAELDALKNASGGPTTKDEGSASAKKRNAEGQKGPEAEERDGKRVRVE